MTVRRKLARLVAALLAGAVIVSGCSFKGAYDLPLPGGPATGDDSYTITASFENVLNLVPKSAVKVDNVTVGAVEDVWREGWHAKVRLRLKGDVKLPDNAMASIRQSSLLGAKYVALFPPTAKGPRGRLAGSDTIPLSRTGRNAEVEEVLGALALLLRGGGVAQLQTITKELNKVMNGREEKLRHLLGELDTLLGTLDRQKQQIVRAIEGINRLTETLRKERETIATAIDEMAPAVEVLANQREQLTNMLEALSRLGKVGSRVIEQSKEDTLAALRKLEPILTKLNEAGDSLPRALSLLVTFPFPPEAFDAVEGDYSNVAVKVDLSLKALYSNMLARDAGDSGAPPGGEAPDTAELNPLQDLTDLGKLCRFVGAALPALDGDSVRHACGGDTKQLSAQQRDERIRAVCTADGLDPGPRAARVCREHGADEASPTPGPTSTRDGGSGETGSGDLLELLTGGFR